MSNGPHDVNRQDALEDEAIDWIARLASGDATQKDKQQAQEWCERSPDHAKAYRAARQLWVGMEKGRDAFPLPEDFSPSRPNATRPYDWRRWAVAAMLSIITLGALIQHNKLALWFSDYRTGTGEQQSLTLADGSNIHLNTNTALSVEYTPEVRRIELHAGEAQFVAAKDPSRPFIVHAAQGQTHAVGTDFVVRVLEGGATVTLLEGLVDVTMAQPVSRAALVRLHPGEQVTYDLLSGLTPTTPANPRLANAWQRGVLIFEGASLRSVVEELNRYRSGYLVLANDEIADYQISGVFYLADLDHALTSIQSQFDLSLIRLTDYIVFLQ